MTNSWYGATGDSNHATSSAEFDRLVAATRCRVYRHVYRMLGNAMDAEDVTQDAYMRAWQHFDRFDASRAFEPWLLRIATNRAIDLRRRKRAPVCSLDTSVQGNESGKQGPHELAAADSNPEHVALIRAQEEQVMQALEALSPRHRQALLLLISDALSYDEIAQRLNCPVGTVRSRVHRARVRLLQQLTPLQQLHH